MFKRVLKTLSALVAGHGIQTLTQLLLPPAFIAAYGVQGYGEWLVLSAAVGYLGTLDFGLQTYVLNELTALYHRNEIEQFHKVQSVGLWLMLIFVGGGVVLACGAFFLPLSHLLKISAPSAALSWAIFCLALQILLSIPLGQVFGVYRTFGQAHRGAMWGNLSRLLLLGATLGLAIFRAPFWAIALGQVITQLMTLAAGLLCLKLSKPEVCPRLDYWDKDLARQVLKPSAFFAFFGVNQFLIFQAPVLILNRAFGAHAVVAFSVCRTLFSFVRQGNSLLQAAVAPEVTRLNGVGDRDRLVRVYLLSESTILAAALVINVGLLLMSPTILWLWLKRPGLFDLKMFLLMMVVSVAMSVKDYKLYFQYATNNHRKTALVTFISYMVLIGVSYPTIGWIGVNGFLILWAGVEILQIALLHLYNVEFLQATAQVTVQPAVRLAVALLAVVSVVAAMPTFFQSQEFLAHAIVAACVVVVLCFLSYHLFGLGNVFQEWKIQLAKITFG